jgi:hypothetical protein
VKQPIPIGDGRTGDEVQLTAPDGFSLTWIAPLAGIGGGCDASKEPHIFIDQILPMPANGSKNPLHVIVESQQHNKSLAVVDATSFPKNKMKIGDTGDCLFYPIFRSKHHADLYLVQFSELGQFGNGGESHDGSESLTDDQYLQRPDTQTTLKIFESLRY